MAAKVTLEMSIRNFKKLAEFLDRHEREIAVQENAYGELAELFELVFDQKASEDSQ